MGFSELCVGIFQTRDTPVFYLEACELAVGTDPASMPFSHKNLELRWHNDLPLSGLSTWEDAR